MREVLGRMEAGLCRRKTSCGQDTKADLRRSEQEGVGGVCRGGRGWEEEKLPGPKTQKKFKEGVRGRGGGGCAGAGG